MYASTLIASLATVALVTFADAHGVVYQIEVAGQTFTAPLIGDASSNDGPIYVPSTNGPVTDVTSSDMFCGAVAVTATTTPAIDLSQGNNISFYWNSGYSEGTNWPHNTGPMFLYMALCSGDCTSQTPSATQFMKIEQQGIVAGEWTQASLMTGAPATFTIPSDLASGHYLLRHEIINLASTDENYPSCSQFAITGGSNKYSSAETATFPGGYSANDAGLTVAGSAVYSIKTDAQYVFPGPNPIIPSDGSSSGSGSSVASSTTSGSSVTSSTSTPTPTSGSSVASSTFASTSVASSTASTSSVLSTVTSLVASSETTKAETSTSTASSSSSLVVNSCDAAWTACNAAWLSAESTSIIAASGYTCQTDRVNCMAGSSSSDGVSITAVEVIGSSSFVAAATTSLSVVMQTTISSAPIVTVASSTATTTATASATESALPYCDEIDEDDVASSLPVTTASSRSIHNYIHRRHHAGISRMEIF